MTGARWRCNIAAGLLVPLLAAEGCARGWKSLDRESLTEPEPARSYRVVTHDGRQFTFIDLHREGESLVGTVRETDVEPVGEGDAERANVTNRYEEVRLPWGEVESVEAESRRRVISDYILVAGAIGVGVTAFLLLSGNQDTAPHAGGGGK